MSMFFICAVVVVVVVVVVVGAVVCAVCSYGFAILFNSNQFDVFWIIDDHWKLLKIWITDLLSPLR